jgi:transposase-like protein
MTKPIARDPMYRKRVFDADIIELCVRWYITYRLSYRDLVEMVAERGVEVAHSTILRWVTRYVPEFGKRWSRFSKAVGTSWRVDETYISIGARWHYLCRAVDKHWQDGRLPGSPRSRHSGRAGVLSQGARLAGPA